MNIVDRNILEFTTLGIQDLMDAFESDPTNGLSEPSIQDKIRKFGANALELKSVNGWAIFIRQFKSAFIYLLLGALGITLVLGEFLDALMIFLFLFINTTLGFIQEFKSEKVASFLSQFSQPRTEVVRGGRATTISADGLVPGDIILLKTGDKIPADVRFIEQKNLSIDESILTGESITVFKNEQTLPKQANAYHEAFNLGFSGTDVVTGTAKALVLSTGKGSTLGKIAKLTAETSKTSDFEKGIQKFSDFILKLIAITLVLMIAGNILIKGSRLDLLELFIFSVALTISVIPEAMPLVTTFSLSQGAKKLADHKVIVKRLSAVQDLGSIEILCSDKTGTLTENRLSLINRYPEDQQDIVLYGSLASEFGNEQQTEPFDVALMEALDRKQKDSLSHAKKEMEEPFNPVMRRNIVLVDFNDSRKIITRGAPEEIISLCAGIDAKEIQRIQEWVSAEGKLGHRTIAVAEKPAPGNPNDAMDLKSVKGFHFLGILSFVDAIKKSTFEAIESAETLGVRVIVITGDSKEVSGAVGSEIRLAASPDDVISGSEWEMMDSTDKGKALDACNVFYRVSPEQKYEIVSALHELNMVGFLGEGINDAPALKIAGVSMVVDSASDIAREAADIILLESDLNVIIEGIREGRRVFANTIKYIKATLISNFGNFFAVATASFLIDFLPMLPTQILLVNLLSDAPMISISSDSADPAELINPNKYEVKEITLMAIILGVVSTVFDFLFFGLFYRISPAVLQTNWFIGSILTELTLIFSIRTKKLFFKSTRPSTALMMLTAAAFSLTLIIPMTTFGEQIFHFQPPTISQIVLIILLVATYFIISEVVKNLFYRNMNSSNETGNKILKKP